jgi:hypothetical protein
MGTFRETKIAANRTTRRRARQRGRRRVAADQRVLKPLLDIPPFI